MNTGEIIQRIQSIYSKGVQSRSTRLSPRHIYSKMLTTRSKLISQEAKSKQKINQWSYQTLNCIELVEAPLHECPCLPPVGCTILKSKYPLPKPLTDYNSHLIQSVTSIEGDVIFNEVSWTEKRYKSKSKFTANKPDYFIRNNYLYITHRSGLKVVSITGVFQNPFEVLKFPSLCEDCKSCIDCLSPLEMEFPIDEDSIDTLVELSLIELVDRFNNNSEDLTNDSKDNVRESSK